MKAIIFRLILIFTSWMQFYLVNAQQPYFISPVTGLQVLDLSNFPLRKDKNYIPIPVLNEEFLNPGYPLPATFPFNYGSNLLENEMSYVVMEDPAEDDFSSNCGTNNNFFTSNFTYPIGHIYQINNNVSTVKLVMQKYAPNFIKGWYKKDTVLPCGGPWIKIPKEFTYTKGELFGNTPYKYGYFEARFKVNRPAGPSNTGIGQCFWLFPIMPPNDPNYERKYCYSEIDIAENFAEPGIQTFGAISSKYDNSLEACPTADGSWWTTSKCNCSYVSNYCQGILYDLYSPEVEQEAFHSYALEWTPSSLKYFYDNRLLATINNIGPTKIPENLEPMAIIFDIEAAIDKLDAHTRCNKVIDGVSQFPFEFEIDYVRLYKMDLSECNQTLPVIDSQISFEAFAFNPKVRKSITISNNFSISSSIAVFGMRNYSFRAAEYIEINDGFEVDTTSEFFADVIGGCDEGY
jgi:beta-glucanase (GH16 family)